MIGLLYAKESIMIC